MDLVYGRGWRAVEFTKDCEWEGTKTYIEGMDEGSCKAKCRAFQLEGVYHFIATEILDRCRFYFGRLDHILEWRIRQVYLLNPYLEHLWTVTGNRLNTNTVHIST